MQRFTFRLPLNIYLKDFKYFFLFVDSLMDVKNHNVSKKNQMTWLITENVSRKAVFMNAGIDYMSKIK